MTAMHDQQESEVGVIPEGWSIASLGDLGRCIRGVSYKPEHLMQETGEGVTTLLRSNNIKNDRVNFDDVQFVAGCKISEDQLARPFDIAICMSNGSKALVGKSGVVTPDHLAGHPRLTVGAFCAIYRSPVLYTAQIFKSQFFQSAIDVQLAGSAINNLKGSDIEGIRFPLPPLEEQQKIAAILTAVDDKLDVIARQIEATQTLKQGLMQTLFSRGVGTQDDDGRWVPHAEFKDSELGEIPASWAVKPLEALAHSITVGIATSTTEHYVQDGVPLIRNQNIKEDFLDMSDLLQISAEFDAKNKSKRVEGGDILTVRTGYPGVSCVVPDGLGRLQTFTTLITRPNRQLVNAHFVSRYFNSPQGKGLMLHQAAGGAQQNINAGNLKKLLVPVPSISEQERIAAVLAALDGKLRSLSSRSEHCQNLKRGLMQKLLTGEWRVNVDASATGS